MKRFALVLVGLGLVVHGLTAVAFAEIADPKKSEKLDLGVDYRFRQVVINNPTYSNETPLGSGKTYDRQYSSQRARIYMRGKFNPGIEVATVVQGLSVAGATTPIIGRTSQNDYIPFIENAYVQMTEIRDWPLNITVGRQPYQWGTGLVLADDGLGFDGIRVDVGPYWGIKTHLFTAKAREQIDGPANTDIMLGGLSFAWGIHNIRAGWIRESHKSPTPYYTYSDKKKAQLDIDPVLANEVTKSYYDFQFNGKLEKGAFYNLEYVIQGGKVSYADAAGATQELNLRSPGIFGSALVFDGGFDFTHPRYKRMILAFVFAQGSGDDHGTQSEDEKFQPGFGHKYDGVEPNGYGEFFSATPYSFFNEDKVQVIDLRDKDGNVIRSFPYKRIFSGIRVWGFRGSVSPWEQFFAGLEFYLFTARNTPDIRDGGAPTTILENAIGRELVISAKYTYAKRITAAVRYGKFFPAPFLNDNGSTRITLELTGRF